MPWKTSDLLIPIGSEVKSPLNARKPVIPEPVNTPAEPDWVPEPGQYGWEKPQVAPAAPTASLKPAQPGPGAMGTSWGTLSPEESRADLAARRAQYNDVSARLKTYDAQIAAAEAQSPYLGQGLRAQRAALAADLPDLKQLEAMEAGTAPLATKTALRAGAENAIKGAGETLVALPEMAGIVAGYLAPGQVDDNALLQWSQGAKEWVRTQFPGDAARQGDFSQQLASGLGQVATFYGTGALAALIKAGPKVGAALVAALGGSATGAQGFEEATKELKKAQAEAAARGDVASVTEFDRLLKTLGYSAVGLTEAVPVARTLGRAVPNPATRLEQRVIAGLKGAGEEALQESGAQLAQNVISQRTTDPGRATLEGVAEGGAVGGVLGGLMGAALPGRFTPPRAPTPDSPVFVGQSNTGEETSPTRAAGAVTPELGVFSTEIETTGAPLTAQRNFATEPQAPTQDDLSGIIQRNATSTQGQTVAENLLSAVQNDGVGTAITPKYTEALRAFAANTNTPQIIGDQLNRIADAVETQFLGRSTSPSTPAQSLGKFTQSLDIPELGRVGITRDGYGGHKFYLYPPDMDLGTAKQDLPGRGPIASLDITEAEPGTAYVGSALVDPQYQRNGVATRLYNAAEKTLGLKLKPSTSLSKAGYQFWLKRNPSAVKSFKWDAEQHVYMPPKGQSQYALKDVIKKGVNQLRAPVSLEATDPNYVRAQAKMLLKAGRAITVPLAAHAELFAAARALGPMIPANVPVMALTKVESLSGNKVRATYTAENGRTQTVTSTQDELFSSRAFVETDNGGRSTMHFTRFNSAEAGDSRVVGELWHETVHALRRQNLLWGNDYARLLGHAENLRVLDLDFRDFLRAIKSPKWQEAESGVSIRELYEDLYSDEFREDPSGLAEAVAEEGVAHMLELAQHSAVDLSAVSDVIARIAAGGLAKQPGSPDLTASVFWAKTSEQVTQEAVDKLKYEVVVTKNSPGEDFIKFKKEHPAVAIQIDEYLMNTGYELQNIKAIKNGYEIVGFQLDTDANLDFFDTNGNAYTELDELLYEKGLIDISETFEPEPTPTAENKPANVEQTVINWIKSLEHPGVKSWMASFAGWDGMDNLNLQSGYPYYVLQYKAAEIWDQDPIKALKLVAERYINDYEDIHKSNDVWNANAAAVTKEINKGKSEKANKPKNYAEQLTEAVQKLSFEDFAPLGVSMGVGLHDNDPKAYQTMTEVVGKLGGYLQFISKVNYPYQGTPTQIGWKIDTNLGDHYISFGDGELKHTKSELIAAHPWLFNQQEAKPEPVTDGFLAEQPEAEPTPTGSTVADLIKFLTEVDKGSTPAQQSAWDMLSDFSNSYELQQDDKHVPFWVENFSLSSLWAKDPIAALEKTVEVYFNKYSDQENTPVHLATKEMLKSAAGYKSGAKPASTEGTPSVTVGNVTVFPVNKKFAQDMIQATHKSEYPDAYFDSLEKIIMVQIGKEKFAYVVQDNKGIEELITFMDHKIYPFKKGDLHEIYNPTDVLSLTEAAKQLLAKTSKKSTSSMEDYKELLNTKLSNVGTDAFDFLYNIAGAWQYKPDSPPSWVQDAGASELWKTDVIGAVLKAVQYYQEKMGSDAHPNIAEAAEALENAVAGKTQQPAVVTPPTPIAPPAPKVSTISDVLNFFKSIKQDKALPDGVINTIGDFLSSHELGYYYGLDGKKENTYLPYVIKDAGQKELWKTDPLQAFINAAQKQAASPYGNDDVNYNEALELIQTKGAKYKSTQKILPAKHLSVADAIKEIGEDFGELLDLATRLADLAAPKNLWKAAHDFMAVGNETAAFAEVLKEEFIDNENPAYESALEEQIILKLYYDLHEKIKPPFNNPSDAIKAAPQIIQDEAKKNGGFISKEFLETWAPDSLEVFNYTNRLVPGEGNWAVAHAIDNYLSATFTEEELPSAEVKALLSGFLPEPAPFAPPTPWALKKAEASNPEPWDLDPENFNPPRFQTVEAARPHVSKFTRNILDEILEKETIKKKYAKGIGNARKAQIAVITGYANQHKSTLTQSVYSQLLEVAAGLQPTAKAAPAVTEEPAAPTVPVPPLLTNDFTKRTFTFSGKAGGGSKPKEIWTDEFGKEYLFKPVQAGKSYLADAEIFGGKIAQLVNPELSPAIFPMTLNDRYGSLQQFLPSEGDISNTPVENLSWADIRQLMRHHVVDYLVSNHDGHAKQFLRSEHGILGIDKGQAFKYFGKDKLALDYHPNEAHGEQEPIYNKLWRAFKEGKLDKQLAEATGGQFADLAPVQQRIKELDAELTKIVENKKKHEEANFVIELEMREKSPFLPSSQPSVSEDYIDKMTAFIKQLDAAITEPFSSVEQIPEHIRTMIESDTRRKLLRQYFDEITSAAAGTPYETYIAGFSNDSEFFFDVEESFLRALNDIVVNHLGKAPHNNKFSNAARFTESGSAKKQYLDGTWLKEFIHEKLTAAVKRDRLGANAHDPQLEQKLKDERNAWADKVKEFEKTKDTVFFEPVMEAIKDVDAKLSNELFTQLLEPYAKGRFKDPVRREAFLDYALYRKNHLAPKFWKFFLEITDPRRRAKGGAVVDIYRVDEEIKTDPIYASTPKLTQLEESAITMYSGSSYRPLNDALKLKTEKVFTDGKINLGYLKQAASGEILSRALKKLPAHIGTVYRGQGGSHDLEQFKAGKLWTSKGFFSTSYAVDSAFGGDIKFVVKSLTGRNIEKYSNSPSEKEILFMPETVFLVTKVLVEPKPYSGELHTIFMEERPQIDWNKLAEDD